MGLLAVIAGCFSCSGQSSNPASPSPATGSTTAPAPSPTTFAQTITARQGQTISNVTVTSTSGPCILVSGVADVWIDNVKIGPCGAQGVLIRNGARTRVTNSMIHTEHGGDTGFTGGDGIAVFSSSDVLIQGNQLSNNEDSVRIIGSPNARIVGNYSLNPLGPGYPLGNGGHHFQLVSSSNGSQVTDNFAEQIPRFRGAADDHRYVEDGVNIGETGNVLVARNYIRDGDSSTGCGITAGDNSGGLPGDSVTITDNVLIRTSNCGIGIAGGSGHVVRRNRVFDSNMPGGSGNAGMYVWDYRSVGGCFGITFADNIVSNLLPDGTYKDFIDVGNCSGVSSVNNTFGSAARALLTSLPPPPIPPIPYVSSSSVRSK